MIRNNLKQLRHKHMMTQTEFAKLLGILHNQYNHWEHNKIQPNLNSAFKICHILKISIYELIEYTPDHPDTDIPE